MPRYVRMWLRDQRVFAQVGADGELVADATGRVEVRYRLEDPRAYRAARANLRSIPGQEPVEAGAGVAVTAAAARPRPPRAAPAAPAPAPARAHGGVPPIIVYTDGACTGNPGPMGVGVVLSADGERKEISEYLGVGTNNIAELTAVLLGLEAITDRERPVRVHADSTYVIGVLARGFKAKANAELIGRIRLLMREFKDLAFVKVEGHAGVPENERCDELARAAVARRA
jgi:ribonuclease HI